jgi:ABC-type antimicrobial peptide transport system permease subunit
VAGNPSAYLAVLRSELTAAQPDAAVASSKTLLQHYQDSLFLERAATRFFYVLGLLALLLTVSGLHGITSALFARRSREFAIRPALGLSSAIVVVAAIAAAAQPARRVLGIQPADIVRAE